MKQRKMEGGLLSTQQVYNADEDDHGTGNYTILYIGKYDIYIERNRTYGGGKFKHVC
jgi:hypothetical protein